MTSDTPRTDAQEWDYYEDCTPADNMIVFASFARTIERELNALRWIPITERLPTIEDGDQFEDVEWSDGAGIWEGNYTKSYISSAGHRKNATHWRSITLP